MYTQSISKLHTEDRYFGKIMFVEAVPTYFYKSLTVHHTVLIQRLAGHLINQFFIS